MLRFATFAILLVLAAASNASNDQTARQLQGGGDVKWEIGPVENYPVIGFDNGSGLNKVAFKYSLNGWLESQLFQDDCVTQADVSLAFGESIVRNELSLDVDVPATIVDSIHYSAIEEGSGNLAFCVIVDYKYIDSDNNVQSTKLHETIVDIGVDLMDNFRLTNISTFRTPTCDDGVQNSDETGIDCGGSCGACPPSCDDGIQNGDESWIDCGGSCDACPPSCWDGIQNGDETGVDCGGSCDVCPPSCDDGIQNGEETGIDCGGSCDVCPPSCDDGIQNGDETWIDCGGSCDACPASCWDGIQNGDETGIDCGGSCDVCPPSCDDGIQNGDETGIDCGGSCDDCIADNAALDYPVQAYFCLDDNSADIPVPLTRGSYLQICVNVDDSVTDDVHVSDIATMIVSQPNGSASSTNNIAASTPDPLTVKNCNGGICNIKTQLPSKYFTEPNPTYLQVDGMATLTFGTARRLVTVPVKNIMHRSEVDHTISESTSRRTMQEGKSPDFELKADLAQASNFAESDDNNTGVLIVIMSVIFHIIITATTVGCCWYFHAARKRRHQVADNEEEEKGEEEEQLKNPSASNDFETVDIEESHHSQGSNEALAFDLDTSF